MTPVLSIYISHSSFSATKYFPLSVPYDSLKKRHTEKTKLPSPDSFFL